ncbi:MAG TPA: hypothetical protein VMH35_28100 [Streptosporangiaceae bacterium]|nr:hypothetical protein [Streptosporangiaceae bacterium]
MCDAHVVQGHGQGRSDDRGSNRDERDLPAGHTPGDDGRHPGRLDRGGRPARRRNGVGEGSSGSGEDHEDAGRDSATAVVEAPTRALLRTIAGREADGGVDEALEAGVLDAAPPDPVLRFSHPLLREAAEGMMTGPGRRRLHRAVGAALTDPDQAAWHLVRGADEPDEELAELAEQAEQAEQAAQHASTRAAPARAAALAQAAAGLTPDPDSMRAWRRRLLWLGQLNAATEFEQVRNLGEEWAPRIPVALRGYLNELRAEVQRDGNSMRIARPSMR